MHVLIERRSTEIPLVSTVKESEKVSTTYELYAPCRK